MKKLKENNRRKLKKIRNKLFNILVIWLSVDWGPFLLVYLVYTIAHSGQKIQIQSKIKINFDISNKGIYSLELY